MVQTIPTSGIGLSHFAASAALGSGAMALLM